jgi:hypothetical protein
MVITNLKWLTLISLILSVVSGYSQSIVLNNNGHISVETIEQKEDIVQYQFYGKKNETVNLYCDISYKQKDYFLFNKKKFLLKMSSPETTYKSPLYPIVSIDNVHLFTYKLGDKDFLIFETAYSGASGKQANYVIFIVFEIKGNKDVNMYMVESYNGTDKDFIKDNSGHYMGCIARTHDGKKKRYFFKEGNVEDK